MSKILININENLVEQIVQQKTEELQNQLVKAQEDLENANAQLTDTQMALCDVYELIAEMTI